jgi:hypothetical protein
MTMLMHTRGPFERAPNSSERRDAAGTDAAEARLATVKRFGICALTLLLAGGALTGIVALRAIAVFHNLNMNIH